MLDAYVFIIVYFGLFYAETLVRCLAGHANLTNFCGPDSWVIDDAFVSGA